MIRLFELSGWYLAFGVSIFAIIGWAYVNTPPAQTEDTTGYLKRQKRLMESEPKPIGLLPAPKRGLFRDVMP